MSWTLTTQEIPHATDEANLPVLGDSPALRDPYELRGIDNTMTSRVQALQVTQAFLMGLTRRKPGAEHYQSVSSRPQAAARE